jgi:hypothetical protein
MAQNSWFEENVVMMTERLDVVNKTNKFTQVYENML